MIIVCSCLFNRCGSQSGRAIRLVNPASYSWDPLSHFQVTLAFSLSLSLSLSLLVCVFLSFCLFLVLCSWSIWLIVGDVNVFSVKGSNRVSMIETTIRDGKPIVLTSKRSLSLSCFLFISLSFVHSYRYIYVFCRVYYHGFYKYNPMIFWLYDNSFPSATSFSGTSVSITVWYSLNSWWSSYIYIYIYILILFSFFMYSWII